MASSNDMEKLSLAVEKASVKTAEKEGKVKKKIDRHCGFCLTLVPGAEVKLCSKCKRRAYCSKECQKADWKLSKNDPAFNGKIHGYGQGHKNWCGLPYGEEDLDFKVAPIPGRGLGLVTLRDLPPLYRIIVEGMQPMPVANFGCEGGYSAYHPGLDDLVPSLGLPSTVISKFRMNGIVTSKGMAVGLRNARLNHNCDSNASVGADQEFNVFITHSLQEVKEGEELCIAYVSLSNGVVWKNEKSMYDGKSPEFIRGILLSKWGITCPPACPCRDEEKVRMLKSCNDLYKECEREDMERINVLHKMEKVIEIAGKLGCRSQVLNNLFFKTSEFAIGQRETLDQGKKYLEMYLKFNQAVYHPENRYEVKMVEKGLEDLSKKIEKEKRQK